MTPTFALSRQWRVLQSCGDPENWTNVAGENCPLALSRVVCSSFTLSNFIYFFFPFFLEYKISLPLQRFHFLFRSRFSSSFFALFLFSGAGKQFQIGISVFYGCLIFKSKRFDSARTIHVIGSYDTSNSRFKTRFESRIQIVYDFNNLSIDE